MTISNELLDDALLKGASGLERAVQQKDASNRFVGVIAP